MIKDYSATDSGELELKAGQHLMVTAWSAQTSFWVRCAFHSEHAPAAHLLLPLSPVWQFARALAHFAKLENEVGRQRINRRAKSRLRTASWDRS